MCSDENMFYSSFRYSLICCKLYSFLLKVDQLFLVKPSLHWLINQSWCCVVCCDIFISTIENFYYSCLLLLSHWSWNIFSLLAKESIRILCCLLWYVSLNCCSSSSSCLLLWFRFSWKSFISMDKESINIFCSYLWLYGGSMASCFEYYLSKASWSFSE